MNKKIEKTYSLFEVLNLCAWYNNFFAKESDQKKSKLKSLPLRTQWNLQQNIKQLIPDAEAYEKFRNDAIADVQKEYVQNNKFETIQVTDLDKQGNPVLDNEGNPSTHQEKRIKDEYIDEYNEKITPINDQLVKMLSDKKTYTIIVIDLDAIIDADNGVIEVSDLDMLSAFGQEED